MKQEHMYNLQLTKRQLKSISYACDRFSRLICGQDWTFRELMETAWEKRCKKVTGKMMDKDFEGGWRDMRAEADEICKKAKKRFWGVEENVTYGIGYDDMADILYDLHQVIRHQLWLDRPESQKSHITLDAFEAVRVGNEPLAKIERAELTTEIKNKKI